jgi:signal transduction histidine kinase
MESMIEEDRGKVIELIEGLIQNPEKSVQIDIRKIGPDKTIRATLWEFACLRDKKGIPCEIQCVGIDYTERKKAEDERDKLLEITKKQNEILKNFAQIISHNFRSYAANIYGLIDILSDEKPELRENEFFVSLRESSDKLNTAIDDVSLLLRMQAQGELNLEQIHLKSALQEVFASLSALFSEKDVIYTDCLSGQERVIAEHSYLKSILTNILTNAVKYSSPERESFLRITSLEDKQFVRVDFEGNGLGIDLEKYGDKLFGLYKTFHDNQDAHGLGLHMTKNQIEQLGGKIEVRSKVGEGTCFSVYLKKAFT